MAELKIGMEDTNISSGLVQIVLTIAAAVVAFIIFNEVYAEIFGKALIG
jgi:hypothetical protein